MFRLAQRHLTVRNEDPIIVARPRQPSSGRIEASNRAVAILDALAKTGFNRTAAAKLLGITFRALRYRMQRLGIREPAAGGPGA